MDYIDYYKILGIEKNATDAEIKAAYRKHARKHHPDLNPNDKEAHKKFQQINEANEVLSDPEKRKKYDTYGTKYGKDWQHGEAFEKQRHSQQSRQFNTEGADFSGMGGDFSDFFASMFGNESGGKRQTKFRGEDYNAELRLGFEDAAKPHQQTLNVNGKKVRITIPAGVENRQVIKLKGHGGQGINGGPNGDLYITFVIAPHPVFKRSGNDLHAAVDIDLFTALLGGEATLDTLSGKVKLKINPETQNGTKIRLKGKGFPVYKQEEQFGDLYITFNVKLPASLSEKEKELFEQLANLRK